MSESQSRYGQSPEQSHKDPCGPKPDPKPDPCADPQPDDCRPPCPGDEKCREPKCPEPCPPKFVPPAWCEPLPPEPEECPDPEPSPSPSPTPEDPCGPSPSLPEQLARLKSKSVSLQKVLRDLEPRKGEMEDLDGRIKALQARVDEQTAKDKDYKEFYRGVDLVRTDIECFIPTARCHLELKDFQKRCVCAAIERVDKRIAKAKQEAEHARIRARWAERHHKNAKAKLEWAQKYWDFIEKDLRERIKKVKEQLVDLKGKVDPNQDQCIAYFYLYELERLIKTCGGDDRCWDPLIGVGNFLDCWDPDCYTRARNRMLAEFNDAAATEKLRESELKQADQLAADLKTQYETAESKRQDNILAEIAADDCCAKCPPASKEGAGREAR